MTSLVTRHSQNNFESALSIPQVSQEKILKNLLKKNETSQFFKEHALLNINSISEYRNKLSVLEHDDYLPWIDKIRAGEKSVLTNENVLSLCPTSGNSSGQKLIPYTKTLKSEFMSGIYPWLRNLIQLYPGISKGKAYWIVTPSTLINNDLNSSVLEGFEEDESYFGSWMNPILKRLLISSNEVSQIENHDNFIYTTLYNLLECEDLSWISLWNPSTFLAFWNRYPDYLESICKDIYEGTLKWPNPEINISPHSFSKKANRTRAKFIEKNIEVPEDLWPKMSLISCWNEGWASLGVNDLQNLFPKTPIQGKGLLATEGLISIPYNNQEGSLLGVTSHFLEFEDIQTREILCSHELKNDGLYSVIITQGGGLYRYRLGDIIQVLGKFKNTPRIKFLRREGHVVDVIGEKMNSSHVEKILRQLYQKHNCSPSWSFLSPVKNGSKWTYSLFLPKQNFKANTQESFKNDLEELLNENYHYRHGRQMQQLRKAEVIESNFSPKIDSGKWSTHKIEYLREPGEWINSYIKDIA